MEGLHGLLNHPAGSSGLELGDVSKGLSAEASVLADSSPESVKRAILDSLLGLLCSPGYVYY